jgi:hypothetical protein
MEQETKSKRRRHERIKESPRVVLNERDKAIFSLLNPRFRFKYLTTSAIAFFVQADNPWKLDVLKRRLRQLYDTGYLDRPEKQRHSPNSNYKDLVYERTDKAARLVDGYPGASHRSQSYPHEFLTDLGFYAPLHVAAKERGWTLTDAEALLNGAAFKVHTKEGIKSVGFPSKLRESDDPFLIDERGMRMRLDGTPILIDRGHDLTFIPGIEVDRSTEPLQSKKELRHTTLTKHIDDIMKFREHKLCQRHYGFTSFFVPIICVNETHTKNAMAYLQEKHGPSKQVLFKTVPDLAYAESSPKISSEVILSPWKRVGHDDFLF